MGLDAELESHANDGSRPPTAGQGERTFEPFRSRAGGPRGELPGERGAARAPGSVGSGSGRGAERPLSAARPAMPVRVEASGEGARGRASRKTARPRTAGRERMRDADREDLLVLSSADEEGASPPTPPRTKWTRCVPHPVLIGHAASLTP